MYRISYSDVFSIALDREYDESISPGDLVRTGSNQFPHFQVIAVHGDMGWLRDVQTGADHLVPLLRCRKLEEPALALAAE